MIRFLCKRFLNYLVLTTVATVAAYFLASITFNPRARFEGVNPPVPESSIQHILNAQNVNPKVPVWTRFWRYCDMVVHGSLGTNSGGHPVAHQITSRIGVTLELLLVGSLIGALIGIAAGVVSAVKQYRLTDNAIGFLSYVTLATPVFVIAILLELPAIKINSAVGHNVINFTGPFTPDVNGGFLAHVGDRISHLLLPTVCLALFGLAGYSRYQRSAMLEVLGNEYIRTARAKGLTRGQALIRHGLRMALIPMSVFFAYSFGTILAGAAMIEKIFGWHGMGELFLDAIGKNDVNTAVAGVGFTSILILLAGMASDIVYATLDPRVR